ncbi:MAG: Crp/Fnr family transcriptional regulator [Hyphomicrobiales bacterium]|nr:Crp/Fnr family transcriptional regulator [Hyphomicrobiales bacterium]
MTDWVDGVPALAGLEPAARALLADVRPFDVEAGRALFTPGSACSGFAVVLSGVVRVGVNSEGGRALTLYRVARDEVCVQTTLCLMAGLDYTAEGVTETQVRMAMIPAARFDALMAASKIFRTFVFSRFGARLQDISKLLETIAFARVDSRLAATLLARADTDGTVAATHQALAEEMGTAREVVSRQLDAFAKAGLVRTARGEVRVLDRPALEARASVT